MIRIIHAAQAQAALKSKQKPKAKSQQRHIHYPDPMDQQFVANETEAKLREMMQKSDISHIWITSTVRDARAQATAMLGNLRRGKHVSYYKPGRDVQKVASDAIKAQAKKGIKDDEAIIEAMMKKIDEVELVHVTHHVAVAGQNTVDISKNGITKWYEQAGYDRFVETIKGYVAQGEVSRFGWPEGPEGEQKLFVDDACLHLEFILKGTDHAATVDI